MTYAIVEVAGKQLWVEAGRFYDIDRQGLDPDVALTLENVLLLSHDGETTVGQPYVEGASVEATVMSHLRGKKIIVYKMKPKKKYRKKQGHRQDLTRIMVESISLGGKAIAQNDTADGLPVSESEVEA
ncbi:MAG: 50S ribosomal protein L21 [Synechococcales cyanobacterium CRU_2_2]|nr:50S ribosomal protein L21 [Synechococcales cyanobacterium CRU_2_2]